MAKVLNPQTGLMEDDRIVGQKEVVDPLGEKRTLKYGVVDPATGQQYQEASPSISLPKTEVSMIDTGSAISQVTQQNQFLDKTYPVTQQDGTTQPTEAPKTDATSFENRTSPGSGWVYYGEGYWQNDKTGEKKNLIAGVEAQPQQSGLESGYNQAASDVENLTKDFLSYNIDADPAFQSTARSIQGNFAKLKSEMERTNFQRQRAFETLGLRSGATQYAGGIQMGIEGEELNQANQRLSDIAREESEAIMSARTAYETGKFNQFNQKVNALKDLREEKTKELAGYNQKLNDFNKKLSEQQTQIQSEVRGQQIQSSILETINQGFKDPLEILTVLESAGIQATPDEVKKYTSLIEKQDTLAGLDQDLRTYEYLKKNEPNELSALGVKNYNDYLKVVQKAKTAPKATGGGKTGGVGGGQKYASDLDAIIGATLSTISSKFGQQQFQAQLNKARNDADRISLVASQVLKGQSADIKNDFNNQTFGVKQIDKALAVLEEKTKTGVIQAGKQYVYNLAGKDFDPNLAKINGYIISAIQPYRNSITGAAWGEQEDAEYQALFGSIKYSPTELKQRLLQIKEIMKDKSVQALNSFVNPLDTFENPFVNKEGQFTGERLEDNNDGTYTYINNDGTVHTGEYGDNYVDRTAQNKDDINSFLDSI